MTNDLRTRETLVLIVEAALSGSVEWKEAGRQLIMAAWDYLQLGEREYAIVTLLSVPVSWWNGFIKGGVMIPIEAYFGLLDEFAIRNEKGEQIPLYKMLANGALRREMMQ